MSSDSPSVAGRTPPVAAAPPMRSVLVDGFLAAHRRGDPLVVPNPWDVGSARLFAGLGFAALSTTSAGHARSLGRGDGVGAVTRDEALAHAADIVAATPLPVTADLEGGYGDDPEDVARTVRMAAAVGLAGGSIEDASGDPRRPVYDHARALDRIVAAVEAAAGVEGGFVLTARAENFLFGVDDLDDTLRRLRAFAEAGADVLYAPGLPDLAAVRTVTASVDLPVNVLADRRWTVAELAEAGVARITTGSALSNLAFGAAVRAARSILDDGSFAWAEHTPTGTELEELMRDGST